jgi:hypothetical protein
VEPEISVRPRPRLLQLPIPAYTGNYLNCSSISINTIVSSDVKVHILLVFWPHSVFGQNHLYVRMLETGIPLFRVKLEEFQSSLSAVRTMCHPVRTPICLLFHPSGRRVFLSGRQTDKHHLSGRRVSSVRTPTSYREAYVPACSVRTFQQHVRTPISSRTVH